MRPLLTLLIYFDLHLGVSRWRERWQTHRGYGRCKGVWDASLCRETLILRDGRRLTYFLDGPQLLLLQQRRQNIPHIFVFHAMFLSGNSFLMTNAPDDFILVCVNRPGYFGSDPVDQMYTYEKFAMDMEQLADHLKLDSFFVAGHSSGGPCSLACAAYLPQRVSAVGILSGDPEYAHESVPNKHPWNTWLLGCLLPWLLRSLLCFLPLARNAVQGLENDFRLETSLYPFRTESIHQPTIVFVGDADRVIPMEVSRHVHERLPNAHCRIVPKIGHLGLLRDAVLLEFFNTLICLPRKVTTTM
jgi:pimeloyl-ACP methyl ester carboxylesterase